MSAIMVGGDAWLAARRGKRGVVVHLAEPGASVTLADSHGRSPLAAAGLLHQYRFGWPLQRRPLPPCFLNLASWASSLLLMA